MKLLILLGLALIAACTPQVACTAEAKVCPDGSTVGREGPECQFAPCPPIEVSVEHTCTTQERENEACTLQYEPVCGITPEGSFLQFGNGCIACASNEIIGYNEGTCGNGCDYNDLDKSYVRTSAEECSLVRFTCADGTEYFSNECGCGCQIIEDEKEYVSTDVEECRTILYQCSEGRPFFDETGCGCEGNEPIQRELSTCTAEEQRVQVCTGEYEPVCGFDEDGRSETYANRCYACIADVVQYAPGECADIDVQ